VRSFALGAGLAIGGMMLANEWLVLAAIAVLASGLLLRFTSSESPGDDSKSDNDPNP
jgi:hypothetical protein